MDPTWKRVSKDKGSVVAGTDVAQWLAERDVDTITIVGYMTNNCDIATAVGADELGLAAEILSDATGAIHLANEAGQVSAERLHETLLVLLLQLRPRRHHPGMGYSRHRPPRPSQERSGYLRHTGSRGLRRLSVSQPRPQGWSAPRGWARRHLAACCGCDSHCGAPGVTGVHSRTMGMTCNRSA